MFNDRTMPPLALHCLGTFEVRIGAAVVSGFQTDKIRALLAYLALEARPTTGSAGSRPHRRELLAGLLWPDMPDALALSNLRLALHRLRQTLDRALPGAGAALLTSTRQTVELTQGTLTVDVTTFEALLAACAAHGHTD